VLGGIAIVVALVPLVSLAVQVGRLNDQVTALNTGVTTEIERQNQLTQQLEANQRQATRHLREVRELLNLSPGAYRFPDAASDTGASDTGADPTTGNEAAAGAGATGDTGSGEVPEQRFFDAVDRIAAEAELESLEATLVDRVPRIVGEALPDGAALRSLGRMRWEIRDGDRSVATLYAGRDRWTLVPEAGTRETVEADAASVADEATLQRVAATATEAVETHRTATAAFRGAAQELREHVSTPAFQDAVDAAQLVVVAPRVGDPPYSVSFRTTLTGDTAFSVSVSSAPLRISVDDASFDETAPAIDALDERVRASDPRTAAQRATEAAIERVRSLADDPAFEAFLDERGLRMATDLRESLDFFYLDLVYREGPRSGERYGAFAVQKRLGRLYITDAQDVVITTLARAGENPLAALQPPPATTAESGATGDRSLPESFPPGFRGGRAETTGTNILLVGTHEQRADAMILAHLSPEKTISMISIPRDLWWQGRKLSYHAEVYGLEHLVAQIQEITAQEIDGWIAVDMYAFIEVVDLLGGVDVTLDEPLIDPTYRVRDAGEWSTLYYEAGTHHLGGVEALRLARSRHTSNDFERAQRQQMILSALRARLNELNAGDLDRVYQLIGTMAEYVTTSYSVWEIAQFYLGYRNAEIVNRTGLTFDNVLYNTWSNLYIQGLDRSAVDDDFYLGQWILLPRDDNWNVIPWFIENNIR